MKKLFITHQLALKLKELGFDEPCWAWWHIEDCDIRFCYSDQRSPITNSRETEIVGLPLWDQVFNWFREKYNLHANINPTADTTENGFTPNGKYSGTIDDVTIGKEMIATDTVCLIPISDNYQLVQEACLTNLIKIVQDES